MKAGKKIVVVFLLLVLCYKGYGQKQYSLFSPDKSIEVNLELTDSIYYSIKAKNKQIINKSAVSLNTSSIKQKGWKVSAVKRSTRDQELQPVVWQKNKNIRDYYQELRLSFTNDIALEWRAYNDGVAWRWLIHKNGAYTVLNETAQFSFHKEDQAWYPLEDGFFSHNERHYHQLGVDSIGPDQLASLPALFQSASAETKILVTESDLRNYAGMWLRGTGNGKIKAVFPFYPKTKEVQGDRNEVVVERENYIAKLTGPQSLPWRILAISDEDTELLNNQLVYQLASQTEGDYSWVKPGKVSWDWWNANNVYNVDFRAGINTKTYKYYIDFASKHNIEYVIMDEGWSDTRNLMKVNPDIDMEELSSYAAEKGVDLILWANWLPLDKQLEETLDQFVKWKVKGIKVDFMQRDDQEMVNFYERVAKAAAARKLLVDFHGAHKPAGLYRTYPNVMSYEGVLGLEQNKGSNVVDPEHNVTIPFIRMVAGPMDYTPGAMLNAQKEEWKPVWSKPMSMGTRAHQLAMFVVYESPLQMLADSPTHYYEEPESMEFLEAVPVVWEKTIPLKGQIGEYVLMARKSANGDWYVGGMTDWNARTLAFDLSFLEQGKEYTMYLWKDGINADRNAQDYKKETKSVSSQTSINAELAPGGGWVARIIEK
ncbi:glycoside hydrolase family 97 protein [Cesiribacter sp. SM1]|uniref:glycoside hydrolase family 97 protein n=1 Tax=Cesiribacter sp. SM1 TaxID=2861196 RepID=UPI001CD60A79|nr:glycoside hydrolase family 97 protein [Cesiribacter sp. SM1]